jgi:hypothetical protein
VVVHLAGNEEPPVVLSDEKRTALDLSKAAAARGELPRTNGCGRFGRNTGCEGTRTDDPAISRMATPPFPYLVFYEATDDEFILLHHFPPRGKMRCSVVGAPVRIAHRMG